MAVASMLAAAVAIAVLRVVAELPPEYRRYTLLTIVAFGSATTLWAWAKYEMFFAELQHGLGPIGTVSWVQGKIGLAWRYALLSGLATLVLTALLWLLRAWLSTASETQTGTPHRDRDPRFTSGSA